MGLYFTSDLHWWHLRMQVHRGYATMDDMHADLVQRWNEVVGAKDEVYVLGDVSFANGASTANVARFLGGRKYVVPGNHDAPRVLRALAELGWTILPEQVRRKFPDVGHRVTLNHCRLWTWPNAHHGALHLHGHSHGTAPEDNRCTDVGVDGIWGRAPIAWEVLRNALEARPYKVVDHHA